MFKNLYQLWKNEVKECRNKNISVFYHEHDNTGDWSIEYREDKDNNLIIKNIDKAILGYYRDEAPSKVGDGDLIMYINEFGEIEIDPEDSIFEDIRAKMSKTMFLILKSYESADKDINRHACKSWGNREI